MGYYRHYALNAELDDNWELIPDTHWTWDVVAEGGHLVNRGPEPALIWLRCCAICGDSTTIKFASDTPRRGEFTFGYAAGFEYLNFKLDLTTGALQVDTHEHHKAQPRWSGTVARNFDTIRVIRRQCRLTGLPYPGSTVAVYLDETCVVEVDEIDFLPECHFILGLHGPGDVVLASLTIDGPSRPRPEYVSVGAWQQTIKDSTSANVDGLITGVRAAAEAGVEILVTPETSLTGLRPEHPELHDEAAIQQALARFCEAVRETPSAPYVMVGYPEWIDGREVDGATLDRVRVNAHRFVCPDGSLGPRMAKVHSCELHLWHGRHYNLQRVAGVEVAVGICHDGRYRDVWTTGVMGGARLCVHASAGGALSGDIPDIVDGYQTLGNRMDAWWVTVNASGGAAIVYPEANTKTPDAVVALPDALTVKNPSYPTYSPMGDQLCHSRIRLWEAVGCWPNRTLRSGQQGFNNWSRLVPTIAEV